MTRLPAAPDQDVLDRRDAWIAAHRGWKIGHAPGLPGWWEATLDGVLLARYEDLGDLMGRLETSYQVTG